MFNRNRAVRRKDDIICGLVLKVVICNVTHGQVFYDIRFIDNLLIN